MIANKTLMTINIMVSIVHELAISQNQMDLTWVPMV